MNSVLGDVNLNAIRNFVKIAKLGNITKAADELYITQPTLSRQLVQLENSLSVKLFNRNRSGVELTASGEIVYKQCLNLLNAYDTFCSTILNLQSIISGNLNIAHQKNCAEFVFNLHSDFLNQYPKVTISNFRQGPRSYIDLLMAGKLHLAYLPTIELSQHPSSINSLPIITKRNMLLVSMNNPLSRLDRIHIAQLKDESFIMPSKTNAPFLLQEIVDSCEAAGFTPKAVSYCNNFVDYMTDILRYDAVSIHPYMPNVEGSGLVKYLELDGFPQEYPLSLIWNSGDTNPLIPVYIDFVKNYLVKTK